MVWDRKKYEYSTKNIVRDIRPVYVRFGDWLQQRGPSFAVYLTGAGALHFYASSVIVIDLILILYLLFTWWLFSRKRALPFKMPADSPHKDANNIGPGASGKAEGILYLGNDQNTKEELWFSNSDARTHFLYLGTTGSGKTVGLKSLATNALSWGSGFIYIDGKADTDLWSSLSALVRRFGRDDDLLVLNYMTGNSDARAPSNTMNPFSSGSAQYLANMLISLMPEAEGDNAMWKERAVSLIMSLMPALTWKRDNQDLPLSVSTIRDYMTLEKIIYLSKDEAIPERIRRGLEGYLETLPGYVADAFDEEGQEKPMGPDQPMVDSTTVRQQHGYLTMQFTRALQSLGEDYGYIFDTQNADIDMVDVVLNRRILVVLIPALEKSGDEAANLGKIVSATIKGMMGSTLGSTLEGESAKVIENRPTFSSTPFMTIFDEVGYYTAPGMAVMAAQARSLGFSLVFSSQDLQSMEKRVKEEARSITANCNIKIFGKLEDPTQTKDFYEKHIGSGIVAQVSAYKLSGDASTGNYTDSKEASIQTRGRSDYDDLVDMLPGEVIVCFRREVVAGNFFFSNPGQAKAMRVTRYASLPQMDEHIIKHAAQITKLRDRMAHKSWTAVSADVALDTPEEITTLLSGLQLAEGRQRTGASTEPGKIEPGTTDNDAALKGIGALGALHATLFPEEAQATATGETVGKMAGGEGNEDSSGGSEAMKTIEKAAEIPADNIGRAETGDEGASAGTSPMGFFSAPDTDADSVQLQDQPKAHPSAPAETAAIPAETSPPPTQAAERVSYVKKQLSADVERILKEAGGTVRNAVFKKDDDR